MGVRRSTLLGVVRTIRIPYGYPAYIPGEQANLYPDPSIFHFAFGRYQKQYNQILTIHLRDPLTGETESTGLTLSSDRLLTLDEIDNAVLAYGPALEGSPKLGEEFSGFEEITGYTIDAVRVAP